ncbi:MAG: PDR/VanB family oxidoreductase, partial [Pseudomonadota bacterium]|nr:PDR/VanB family oxidoreductase [Pseudomonadota bacterium]
DKYEIAVLKEEEGRGGSRLLHRIFTTGRKLFVSPPINHFELVEDADYTLLMGGGIGITPMLTFAHRLYQLGRPFEIHYSVSSAAELAFADEWAEFGWADRVHMHISEQGSRLDADALFSASNKHAHIYICGPDAYMASIRQSGLDAGFEDEHIHIEYFSVPEQPDYINLPFRLKIASTGQEIPVTADQSAADALNQHGFAIDVKCADGLCGVCQCSIISGAVEHRDFVLSKSQQKTRMILCQSRAKTEDSEIEIEL